MIVKVCGMRESENIRAVEQTGADWMGFIFYPPSPRFVRKHPGYLPVACKRVGVFVDEDTTFILRKVEDFGLHFVQLHGRETPRQCAELKEKGVHVIKTFSISTETDLLPVEAYEGLCDYFLFDTACAGRGGSGKTFRWNILACYRARTPFLLSGGIRPTSLEALSRFRHEYWAGIDLNSGFETAPARKDAVSLHAFIKQIKSF